MFRAIWEWIKAHWLLTLGLVVGVFLFWRLAVGGSSTTASGVDPSLVQAGLAQYQIDQQNLAAAAHDQATLQAQQDNNATSIAIATLAAQLQHYQTEQSAQIAALGINTQAATQQNADSLSAQIAANTLATQAQLAQIQASTITTLQQSNADVQKQLIKSNEKVATTSLITKMLNPCFVTTACCEVMGLPDDCWELTMLRKLRDEHGPKMPDGAELIANYYKYAPKIVAGIKARPDADKIFYGIYHEYIRPCARAVDKGRYEHAAVIYREMFDSVAIFLGAA